MYTRQARGSALLAVLSLACARPVATSPSNPAPATDNVATVVPIRIVNNHVHLHMSAGGHDLAMIYDTGAGITVLDIPVAESLGFKLGRPVNMGGAGANPVRAFSVSGGALSLPQDTTIRVTPAVALGMNLSLFEGIPVNGILGADFTRQSVLQLDYANQRMTLYPRSFRYSGNGVRIPISFVDGHPHA